MDFNQIVAEGKKSLKSVCEFRSHLWVNFYLCSMLNAGWMRSKNSKFSQSMDTQMSAGAPLLRYMFTHSAKLVILSRVKWHRAWQKNHKNSNLFNFLFFTYKRANKINFCHLRQQLLFGDSASITNGKFRIIVESSWELGKMFAVSSFNELFPKTVFFNVKFGGWAASVWENFCKIILQQIIFVFYQLQFSGAHEWSEQRTQFASCNLI